MEKAITTILLTVASVVAMLVVINAVFPSVNRTSGAIRTAGSALDERIKSDVEIVHATGADGQSVAYIWVKNVGSSTIGAVDRVDVFFGEENDFVRYSLGIAPCAAPCWEGEIESAAKWEPTATLKITIRTAAPLTAGSTYYVKVVVHNGTTDSRYFTL